MTTDSLQHSRGNLILLAASFLIVHALFWIFPDVFESWNSQTFDQLFRVRSSLEKFRPPYDSTIVHVDISDRSLLTLGDSYLNRSHYAQVVQNLTDAHVAAQAWDFIFPARSNPVEDSLFLHSVANSAHTYFGLKLDLVLSDDRLRHDIKNPRNLRFMDKKKWQVKVEGSLGEYLHGENPLPTFVDLASEAKGVGFISLRFDRDRVFRRVPLLVRYGDGWYPSFPFLVVCDYLGVKQSDILIKPGKYLRLQNALRARAAPHTINIPIDEHGNMVINFAGPWERMKHDDFAKVLLASQDRLDIELLRDDLAGKIVIVSDVATGSSDVGRVPTDTNFPLSGLHANVINTILTENFLTELTTRGMVPVEMALLLLLFVISRKLSGMFFGVVGLGVLIGYGAAVVAVFLYGNLILNLVRPSLMALLGFGLILGSRYLSEAKAREVLRRSFEAYFPSSVVKRIMLNPSLITTGGQKKELTILFSDIKGFTTYSATVAPDQIQKMLNEYFEAMVEIVFRFEGTVDKFIGDGLMVFFGDPEPQDDHALRCVRAAIAMQQKVQELRTRWEREGKLAIAIRIGINTGTVVVGNMGSQKRLSYTVLGSAVNLAQRLEASAPLNGILIAERTFELAKSEISAEGPKKIQVKGLEEPITVYEVLSAA